VVAVVIGVVEDVVAVDEDEVVELQPAISINATVKSATRLKNVFLTEIPPYQISNSFPEFFLIIVSRLLHNNKIQIKNITKL
jgi:hypothetical protein